MPKDCFNPGALHHFCSCAKGHAHIIGIELNHHIIPSSAHDHTMNTPRCIKAVDQWILAPSPECSDYVLFHILRILACDCTVTTTAVLPAETGLLVFVCPWVSELLVHTKSGGLVWWRRCFCGLNIYFNSLGTGILTGISQNRLHTPCSPSSWTFMAGLSADSPALLLVVAT